jgi:hypothetical protein
MQYRDRPEKAFSIAQLHIQILFKLILGEILEHPTRHLILDKYLLIVLQAHRLQPLAHMLGLPHLGVHLQKRQSLHLHNPQIVYHLIEVDILDLWVLALVFADVLLGHLGALEHDGVQVHISVRGRLDDGGHLTVGGLRVAGLQLAGFVDVGEFLFVLDVVIGALAVLLPCFELAFVIGAIGID